jgi:hypothetical protein
MDRVRGTIAGLLGGDAGMFAMSADEIAMPLLGLESPENIRAFELHMQAFGSHIVYGSAAELARPAVRRALG